MKRHYIWAGMAFIAILFVLPMVVGANTEGNNAPVITKDYSGYSIEQIEALIAKLQKQLEELKKGAQCFVTDADLSLGDGEDGNQKTEIKRLQEFLREKGFFKAGSTGYFGKLTRAALIAFQKNAGINASGEYDAATRSYVSTLRCRAANLTTKKTEIKEEKKKEYIEEKKKESAPISQVKSITLSNNGAAVAWTVDGYSKSGFKVVWSKNTAPTYPTRDGDKYEYFDKPATNSASLYAFNGSGTYFVRVCEYLGGACGVYSNELSVVLQ
jgi:peptidoglycan hydrolase-like protein with peptidoglycan-binding domain